MSSSPLPTASLAPSEIDPAASALRFSKLAEALARTSAHTGRGAMEQLIRVLGETLDARRAHISRFDPEQPGRLRFIALWDGHGITHGHSFVISGTASEQVLRHGEQFYWHDLHERFPNNATVYRSWDVTSYLGAPLLDVQGNILGVLCVLFGPEPRDRVLAETVFRLFTARAASELDRTLEEERRRHLEQTLQAVVRGTATAVGAAFFNALVLELSRALGASAVYLTRSHPNEPNAVQRLAGVEGNDSLPAAQISLAGPSPTRDTLAHGYLHVAGGLATRYPANPTIERLGADSFIGIALRSSKGEVLGALTLLSATPLPAPDIARDMLAIFSARAAAEIQRIESEASLARIDQQLRQTQKLEALGTLAGGVAHDFNNILTGILGNTQLAEFSLSKPDEVRRHLGLVVQGCHRARDLIARILAFTRHHEQLRQPCSLIALVREALQLLSSGLPRQVSLRTDFTEGDPHVLADAGQIHQIILNLGTNAVQAIGPAGGTLEFVVAPLPADDPLRAVHPQIRPEHAVRLTVRDTGPGIPPELHERIFEPFFTTKPVGQGTGLGLSTVHGIVRAHRGAIVLDSAPGRGTAFHLCFATVRPPAPRDGLPAPAVAPAARKRRLLLVDDEKTITDLAALALGRLGWEANVHNDAPSALAAFQAEPDAFDVLVTDLAMPGLDGAELARLARELRPKLPVVIITGFLRGQEVDSARKVGVCHFLPKPFTIQSLVDTLRAAVEAPVV